MKENSIEETKKQLELILKVRKEQKEIIECAGGSCMNCDPDIKALSKSIEILLDYKRVLKENEELKIIKSAIQTLQINSLEEEKYIVISKSSFLDGSYKHLLDDYIPIQKIKDKIEELNRKIGKSIDNSKGGLDEEFIEKAGKLLVQKRILQELLERRK